MAPETAPTGEPDPVTVTAALRPVPKCKGCGSQNLVAFARAVVSAQYNDPLGVDLHGNVVFRSSYSGYGENETWRYECEDCGRRMRLKAPPVEAPDHG